VIVLRHKQPGVERPYKTGISRGAVLFCLIAGAIVLNTIVNDFKNSFWGLLVIAAGLPAYFYWRRGLTTLDPRSNSVVGPSGQAVRRSADAREASRVFRCNGALNSRRERSSAPVSGTGQPCPFHPDEGRPWPTHVKVVFLRPELQRSPVFNNGFPVLAGI